MRKIKILYTYSRVFVYFEKEISKGKAFCSDYFLEAIEDLYLVRNRKAMTLFFMRELTLKAEDDLRVEHWFLSHQ
jgi:hypothetical protein